MAKSCGAKTRAGGACKAPAMSNGRCRVHGGASTGPKKQDGNTNAMRHGIYSDLIHPDDVQHCDSILSLSGVENELLIARLQLRRALKAQANADLLTDGMEIYETVDREGAENVTAKAETKKKLRDYPQIIDRLMARIESLEKTRMTLNADNHGVEVDDMTREDTFIAPDEALPDAPIL